MAPGVPGRLKPQIFSTFGTTRVVVRQPKAPAAFTPGEIPGSHFQRLSRPQGTWFCRKEPRKKSPVTSPGIDPGTIRLVAQRLNHYTTPGPVSLMYELKKIGKVFRSKFVGTGPQSYIKRIYWAAVSQRLRNTGLYNGYWGFPEGKAAGAWR